MGGGRVELPVRHLNGHPGWGPALQFSLSGTWWASLPTVQLPMLACGERGHGEGSTHYAWLSSIPRFRDCMAFLRRPFPPQSPPSHSLNPSVCSQQQPSPWDRSTVPKLQLPAAGPSRGPASLSRVCMAVARTVFFSLHLGCYRSAVSRSALNVSPLPQTIALMWGSDPCFNSSTCRRQVQS